MSEVDSFITKFSGLTESYWFYEHTSELVFDKENHLYLLVTENGLKPIPSVTQITHALDKSEILIPWACRVMSDKLLATLPFKDDLLVLNKADVERFIKEAKVAHKEKLEEAGMLGNIAHHWLEQYIKAVLINDIEQRDLILSNFPTDERVKQACIAGLEWMANHSVKWISTEKKIYSKQFLYAGTLDGLALVSSCNNSDCCKVQFKDHLSIIDWKTSRFLYPEFLLQTAAYLRAYHEETKERVTDRFIIRLDKQTAEFEVWHLTDDVYQQDFQAFREALELTRSMTAIKERVQTMKDGRKAVRKAERKAKKLIDSAKQCKGSARYKGIRQPKCNNGSPCEACTKKFADHQAAKLKKLESLKETKAANKQKASVPHELIKSLQFLLDKKPE